MARYFISVHTIEEMQAIRKFINREQLPYWIIGKGSNSLFDDRGFDGVVILNKISFIHFEDGKLHVGAGYSFSLLGTQLAKKGWGGLEFASGIPGSVGGAVYMNAGANGQETADRLKAVGVIDPSGAYHERSDLQFSYRTSPFQNGDEMIVSAHFQLEKVEDARKRQLQLFNDRMKRQPYGEKSAGCIFRNPPNESAGSLIEKCGLKGRRIGGAEVSTLHANFIINRGDASASDVMSLAHSVQDQVKRLSGIELELEVRPIPYLLGSR